MKRLAQIVPLVLSLILPGCAASETDFRTYLAQKGVTAVQSGDFEHCRGYGCRIIDRNLDLPEKDWAAIKSLFKTPVENAAQERRQIAKAIGIFEQKIGAMNGTENDVAGTYVRLGDDQHDCVDESINTTVYLSLLDQKDLLLYHTVSTPSARMPPFSLTLAPHQTAVVTEKETGKRYAVDSWFHDNGHAAEIVAMNKWFYGWHPPKEKQNDSDDLTP